MVAVAGVNCLYITFYHGRDRWVIGNGAHVVVDEWQSYIGDSVHFTCFQLFRYATRAERQNDRLSLYEMP